VEVGGGWGRLILSPNSLPQPPPSSTNLHQPAFRRDLWLQGLSPPVLDSAAIAAATSHAAPLDSVLHFKGDITRLYATETHSRSAERCVQRIGHPLRGANRSSCRD
jgi:hypothetical protein